MQSIKWCHFQWPWMNPNPVFKVIQLFDAEYLTNGYRYGHSYYIDWLHFCEITLVLKLSANARQSRLMFFFLKDLSVSLLLQFVKFVIVTICQVRCCILYEKWLSYSTQLQTHHVTFWRKENNLFILAISIKSNCLNEFLLSLCKINTRFYKTLILMQFNMSKDACFHNTLHHF